MFELLILILEERRECFAPGNNKTWGPGNWIECPKCPDSYGFPSFHHKGIIH